MAMLNVPSNSPRALNAANLPSCRGRFAVDKLRWHRRIACVLCRSYFFFGYQIIYKSLSSISSFTLSFLFGFSLFVKITGVNNEQITIKGKYKGIFLKILRRFSQLPTLVYLTIEIIKQKVKVPINPVPKPIKKPTP